MKICNGKVQSVCFRAEVNSIFPLRYCEMFPRKNVFPGFIINLIVLPLKNRVNIAIKSSM